MSGFNRDGPRTNSIYYGLNTDTGKAIWFSLDPGGRTTGPRTIWAPIRNAPLCRNSCRSCRGNT